MEDSIPNKKKLYENKSGNMQLYTLAQFRGEGGSGPSVIRTPKTQIFFVSPLFATKNKGKRIICCNLLLMILYICDRNCVYSPHP